LSNAISSVNAASAAFAAIYMANLSTEGAASVMKQKAAMHYGIAVRQIQQDLSSQPHGPVPILISCALLCFAELLQRRQFNALVHLQGAMKLLFSRHQYLTCTRAPERANNNEFQARNGSIPVLEEDNLSLTFMTLDIQKASFALGQSPDLAVYNREPIAHDPSGVQNIHEAEQQLVRLIHSCYHFTAQASDYKYTKCVQSGLTVQQGRHIAALSLWLERFSRELLPTSPDSSHRLSSDTQYHALVLRSQCLSTLIYLCTVLGPHEKSYDLHGESFQRIVRDATIVLANGSGAPTELQQFSPSPGMIQPLFLTATKYRHGLWRRQAIELLRQSGREGPFDGKLLAAVASRAVQIEECEYLPLRSEGILPEHIAEKHRVHGCGIDAEAKDDEPMHSTTVMFSRCHDVEQMVSASVPWDHKSNWDMWDEEVTGF
jgi:Fungal specific transcription factor domain